MLYSIFGKKTSRSKDSGQYDWNGLFATKLIPLSVFCKLVVKHQWASLLNWNKKNLSQKMRKDKSWSRSQNFLCQLQKKWSVSMCLFPITKRGEWDMYDVYEGPSNGHIACVMYREVTSYLDLTFMRSIHRCTRVPQINYYIADVHISCESGQLSGAIHADLLWRYLEEIVRQDLLKLCCFWCRKSLDRTEKGKSQVFWIIMKFCSASAIFSCPMELFGMLACGFKLSAKSSVPA